MLLALVVQREPVVRLQYGMVIVRVMAELLQSSEYQQQSVAEDMELELMHRLGSAQLIGHGPTAAVDMVETAEVILVAQKLVQFLVEVVVAQAR